MSLDLVPWDSCNLRCPFCYATDGHGQPPDWERTRATLEWAFAPGGCNHPETGGGKRHITIYGGEPLLHWEEFKRIVEWAKSRAAADGKPISVSTVSNMTTMTAEKMAYLVENKIPVNPSIDGCEAAHNAGRVFPDGSGSFEATIRGAKILCEARPGRAVRGTVSPDNVRWMAAGVRYLHEDMGFSTVNLVQASGATWTPESLEIYDQQIAAVSDWYIRTIRRNPKTRLRLYHLRNAWRMMETARTGRRWSMCGLSKRRVAVDTLGNVWPCHRFANPRADKRWMLGTLKDGWTNPALLDAVKRFDFKRNQENRKECQACPLRDKCTPACWAEIVADGEWELRDGELVLHPGHAWCHIWRAQYREGVRVLRVLRQMRIEYPDATTERIKKARNHASKIVQPKT